MNILILFSSITYAIKARDFLYRRGITTQVKRPPNRDVSCGYCVVVEERISQRVIDIVKSARIPIKEIIKEV